jgi:polyhydroxybutyrate depolymerase
VAAVGSTSPARIVPWLLILAGFIASAGVPTSAGAADPATRSSEHQLTVDGVKRTYYLHPPSKLDGSPVPLVIVFHGGQGDGLKIAGQTGFNQVADHRGFAVAYPNSLGYWNDGRATTTGGSGDDVAFVRALIDHLVKTQNVDRQRVYATGASNGGMFTLRLACEMSDEIAAFAPVVASFPADYRAKCRPHRALPIMMVNGTSDTFIPWQGGSIRKGLFRGAGGEVIPVPDTLEFWRQHNGCASEPSVRQLPDIDKNDGTTAQLITYPNCREVVRMIRIEGGGHTWPGSEYAASGWIGHLVGKTNRDVNASEAIWEFFKGQALEGFPR